MKYKGNVPIARKMYATCMQAWGCKNWTFTFKFSCFTPFLLKQSTLSTSYWKFIGNTAMLKASFEMIICLSSTATMFRFEMPYNIWCGGCNSMIAKGVRFNAEKKQVGNYYSTKVWYSCNCFLVAIFELCRCLNFHDCGYGGTLREWSNLLITYT